MSVKPYITDCLNEEYCDGDVVIEIHSVTLGDPGRWADRWEDSYPATDGEVEYDTKPVCTKCGLVREIDEELDNDICEYADEAYRDSFYDDGE